MEEMQRGARARRAKGAFLGATGMLAAADGRCWFRLGVINEACAAHLISMGEAPRADKPLQISPAALTLRNA